MKTAYDFNKVVNYTTTHVIFHTKIWQNIIVISLWEMRSCLQPNLSVYQRLHELCRGILTYRVSCRYPYVCASVIVTHFVSVISPCQCTLEYICMEQTQLNYAYAQIDAQTYGSLQLSLYTQSTEFIVETTTDMRNEEQAQGELQRFICLCVNLCVRIIQLGLSHTDVL